MPRLGAHHDAGDLVTALRLLALCWGALTLRWRWDDYGDECATLGPYRFALNVYGHYSPKCGFWFLYWSGEPHVETLYLTRESAKRAAVRMALRACWRGRS